VIEEVRTGRSTASEARSYLSTMTMRQNYWTLGAFCAAYGRVVSSTTPSKISSFSAISRMQTSHSHQSSHA
jgi:hypothetical protein